MNEKIPKIIHYFWFGKNKMPDIFLECIKSWQKYCPDYKIIKWDEENFDVNICNYTKQAYEQKKYAFVSDYARFYILKKYGGIYLDIDVEILKPIDELLEQECFCGRENNSNFVATGLIIAARPNNKFVNSMLNYYNEQEKFENGTHTVCTIASNILEKEYDFDIDNISEIQKLDNVTIYPAEYFCGYDMIARKKMITENTYSVHHYNSSWLGPKDKIVNFIRRIVYKTIGKKNYTKLKQKFKKRK